MNGQEYFKCSRCGTEYFSREPARNCCKPLGGHEENDGWICNICGEWWSTKDDADNCCFVE